MFSRHHDIVLADLSTDVSDETDWNIGTLRTFNFPLNISTLAVEPVAGLIAVGTYDGFVHIFGGTAVESKITLPEPVGVRCLHFSIPMYFLVCLDDNNQLHLYNLLEFGRPKIVTSVRFDHTNSITLSPSHTHVFLAMRTGDIRTYDMTCLRKSPYTVSNLWKLYERDMVDKGICSPSPSSQDAVETIVHPRNLNLLFVAYAGGVILMDLTEGKTIHAYELILQPGAPGGEGYGAKDILSHRRMIVTSVAVHPAGHFFAVGYTDGSIAFWAVEDDSKPLMVRTLDDDDVDIVDSDVLQAHLDAGKKSHSRFTRQPVYRLSWSGFTNSDDPRGGETVVTVLGGLVGAGRTGVTIFTLLAFNPPEPAPDPSILSTALHPAFRKAMYHSIVPKRFFHYRTPGPVHDYLLLPRHTPHLGGSFDPYAILFILDIESTRTVEAAEFPPPGIVSTTQEPQTGSHPEPGDVQAVEVAGVLRYPDPSTPRPETPTDTLSHKPSSHLITPFTLSNGASNIRSGRLFTLPNEVYENFNQNTSEDGVLILRGGTAYADADELKISKYQPRRILLTYNEDYTIRFFDLSNTLFIPPINNAPLQQPWPKPITPLTIWLDEIFHSTTFAEKLSTTPDDVSIQSVQVAPEALEIGIALSSGEVIIYRRMPQSAVAASSSKQVADEEITLLHHIPCRGQNALVPYFMINAGKMHLQTFALSDIGFLAISYRDGTLIIVDMRGPRIILSHSKKQRNRRLSHAPGTTEIRPDIITCLKWTICPLDKDPQLRIRLVAILQSGTAEVYTLIYSGNPATWSVLSNVQSFKAVPDALSDGTFIFDANSGAQLRANPARLAIAFKNEKILSEGSTKCVLVSVGAKGVRASASVDGEKVGKVELGAKSGSIVTAQIVAHNQSHGLVLQTDQNNVLAYTLPHLEQVTSITIPNPSPLPLTIDESGDFIAWSLSSCKDRAPSQKQVSSAPHINGATYGTVFAFRRVYPLPDIDFTSTRGTVPPQPQPVSLGPPSFLGGLGSLLSFKQTISGEKVDELLGGPDRPLPEKIALEKARSAGEDEDGVVQTKAAAIAASAAAVQASLYNRLSGALGERGQLLGDLEERLNSLGQGSRSMAAQAKRLATQQTAKSWFGF